MQTPRSYSANTDTNEKKKKKKKHRAWVNVGSKRYGYLCMECCTAARRSTSYQTSIGLTVDALQKKSSQISYSMRWFIWIILLKFKSSFKRFVYLPTILPKAISDLLIQLRFWVFFQLDFQQTDTRSIFNRISKQNQLIGFSWIITVIISKVSIRICINPHWLMPISNTNNKK